MSERARHETGRVDLLLGDKGQTELLLGNEAIVRGALEAGVAFASGYPGTPSSEITDSFARVAAQRQVVFEYSVNEKVAVETAFGASLAGARAMCAMKHLGLMYAGDPISTMPYVGAVGGMVLVSAADPSCRTSPNEQDQRHLAPMLHMPLLDPSTPQEALAMARFAFELSERSALPVILRPTTRVCHSRAVVRFGALQPPVVRGFSRDPQRFVPIPVNAHRLLLQIPARLELARQLLEQSPFVRRTGDAPAGILAAGAPAATTADLLADLGLAAQVTLLSLGAIHPLPERWLLEQLSRLERLLVVEELSPFLEDALQALCAREHLSLQILGKRSGHLPLSMEYDPHVIQQGLHDALGLGSAPGPRLPAPDLPPRPPILCPGCTHRSTYFAAKMALGEEPLYFNDIGCYTLGYGPPLHSADALLCMGAGITLAAGVSRVTGQRTVGFVGDSTLFHSGLPALLNVIKERVNMVVVILDNGVTAMTGFQESPTATIEDGQAVRRISIETAVRGLGAEHVECIDPFRLPDAIAVFERARDRSGVSVVISQRPCSVFLRRETGAARAAPYGIDHTRCRSCGREACAHGCAPLGAPEWLPDSARAHGCAPLGAPEWLPDSGRDSSARCDVVLTRGYQIHIAGTRARSHLAHPSPPVGHKRSAPHPSGAPPLRAQAHSEELPTAIAPCSSRCPLFLCIQGYIGHIAAGEYRQAVEHIMARNPLPETVCRVCHHPCEAVCVRADLDQPLAINDLKRFAMQHAPDVPYNPPREAEHGKRVAVVGAGPSGLCAAHELRLRGYGVTLLDADTEPGGLLLSGIPAFRLPRQALRRDVDRILGLGVEFRGETRLGRDVSLDELLRRFDAVYLATGAHHGLQLSLDGTESPGAPVVVDALAYLRQMNLDPEAGTQARCMKHVLVVGGGNAAIDAARTARRMGAQVTIVYRRRRHEMPALPSEVEQALAEGVELRPQLQPTAIFRGNRPGLECVVTRAGEPDPSGRQRPVPVGGSEALLEADQIIVAVGQTPDPALLALDGDLQLGHHKDHTLRVDPRTGQTTDPRIFAGGDLVPGERTVTWAMAQAQRAAWAIDRSLRGPELADRRPPPPPVSTEAHRPTALQRQDPGVPRQRPAVLPLPQRLEGFDEVVQPLTEDQARAEAARCLACGLCGNCRACIDLFGCPAFYIDGGLVQIDASICTGCGFCADFCPNGAIQPLGRDEARDPLERS